MDHHTENDRLTGYKFSSINVCEGFSIYTDQTELLTKNYGNNWSGASAGPNMKKEMELAWTYVKKK